MKEMQCSCGKKAKYQKELRFQNQKIEGWVCKSCGEIYYNPEQAEKILLINKVKKRTYLLKLSKVKSNLIVHVPQEVSKALALEKGNVLELCIEKTGAIKLQKKY